MGDELGVTFSQIWNFQLFVVEGSPITIGKIVIGLILSIVGFVFAKKMSRLLSARLLARLKVSNSLVLSLEKLIFYALFIFSLLFVMQMLSIPITVFTVLGGALAIGIGFGSQNIVNNFISGLIVMVEQPVRVGDWIEIDNIFGQVEFIGGRSTTVRSLDNKQTIIPNSEFLQKTFINWTLSDETVGARVQVGVAYGSDVQKVKSLLLQAAQEHPAVLKSPEPSVLFSDFADSSLLFTLFFHIHFRRTVTANRVASDLRFRIDELFREHQVSIPFPHRQMVFPSQPIVVELKDR